MAEPPLPRRAGAAGAGATTALRPWEGSGVGPHGPRALPTGRVAYGPRALTTGRVARGTGALPTGRVADGPRARPPGRVARGTGALPTGRVAPGKGPPRELARLLASAT